MLTPIAIRVAISIQCTNAKQTRHRSESRCMNGLWQSMYEVTT